MPSVTLGVMPTIRGFKKLATSEAPGIHFITMEGEVRIFSSFREAEEADTAFYASLSPQERLDLLLDLIARHRESIGETTERFERVYRVTELSRG